MKLSSVVLILCSLFPVALLAQTADPNPLSDSVSVPTVTFTLSWKEGSPSWYSVAVQQMGRASYRSRASESEPDPYSVEFTASEESRKKIFELAEKAKYFHGDFDFKKGRVAQTGAKTLAYSDGRRRDETTFNWSDNQAIQQLADFFQNLSNTMEFGRRLEHAYRFEKLGLERELKRMEELKQANQLPEVQAIQPILKKVAEDKTVVNVSRQRALRLMGLSDAPARSVVHAR